MGKSLKNEHQNQDPTYCGYGGRAVALGEDTFTLVDTNGKIVDHGCVITAKININVTAIAEGGSQDTSADTWVDGSDFDISHLKIKQISLEYDGGSYDISIAKFKGVALPEHVSLPGGPKSKETVIECKGDVDLDFDLEGNVAMTTFNVEVLGENTLANADAFALAIEDSLSESNIFIETAVG